MRLLGTPGGGSVTGAGLRRRFTALAGGRVGRGLVVVSRDCGGRDGGGGRACVVLGQDRFRPVPGVAAADRPGGDAGAVAGEPGLSFAGLLRQLRAEAGLTQEELAEAAGVSPRAVSNLERSINRTAHK